MHNAKVFHCCCCSVKNERLLTVIDLRIAKGTDAYSNTSVEYNLTQLCSDSKKERLDTFADSSWANSADRKWA